MKRTTARMRFQMTTNVVTVERDEGNSRWEEQFMFVLLFWMTFSHRSETARKSKGR